MLANGDRGNSTNVQQFDASVDPKTSSHLNKKSYLEELQQCNLPPSAMSPAIYTVTASLIASIGGILFGYDIGIISGALLLLRKKFHLSDFKQEMVVSIVLIGSFCCSLFGGTVIDKLGRKTAILISGALFIIGALVLSFSVSYSMLLIGRFVVGVAVSLSVAAECTYISELSPPNRRGMLVSLNEVGITIGFLLAYLLNYIFVSNPEGWRYMFGAAIIPSVLQMIGISFMPRSPHFLMMKGKQEEAKRVLMLIRKLENVDEEIQAILKALEEKKSRKYIHLLSSVNNIRGRLFLGMMLVFLQQFSGHANVLYYAPIVFQHFGYCSDTAATLVTVGLGAVKVLSTTFTLLTVDRFGRRRLLLVGCSLMALSVTILGITAIAASEAASCLSPSAPKDSLIVSRGISRNYSSESNRIETETTYISNETFISNVKSRNGSLFEIPPVQNAGGDTSIKYISVISLMIFVCAYGFSYGPVTWLVLSEIFPTALRGRAISIATCVNWGSNIVVSLTFLNMITTMGIGTTLIMYGCISFAASIFILFCVPETKNKTLEQINCELNNGFFRTHQNGHCCRKKIMKSRQVTTM